MGETGAGGGGIDLDDDATRLDLDFVWMYLSAEPSWNRGPVRTVIEDGPGRDLAWGPHTADAHELHARFGFAPPGPRTLERPPPGHAG